MSVRDRLLEVSITVLSRIGFEVRRVRQTVPPLETVLSHYGEDTPTLGSQTLRAARACGDACDVYCEACFMR